MRFAGFTDRPGGRFYERSLARARQLRSSAARRMEADRIAEGLE